MVSGLLAFLGGNGFRMIFGEISAFLTTRENHKQELQRLELQSKIDAAQHARNLEAMKVQSDLGIKVIHEQRDADLIAAETEAWAQIVGSTAKSTGIKFVDAWNGSIRPALATLAIFVVVAQVAANGWVIDEFTQGLVAAILGVYVADRGLSKRGK
jgi:hypothetical protein